MGRFRNEMMELAKKMATSAGQSTPAGSFASKLSRWTWCPFEVWAMWIVFSVFLVLWILSVEFVLPVALTITFFVMVIASAAVALMPSPNEVLDYDDGE
jgi:hypothetical protein